MTPTEHPQNESSEPQKPPTRDESIEKFTKAWRELVAELRRSFDEMSHVIGPKLREQLAQTHPPEKLTDAGKIYAFSESTDPDRPERVAWSREGSPLVVVRDALTGAPINEDLAADHEHPWVIRERGDNQPPSPTPDDWQHDDLIDFSGRLIQANHVRPLNPESQHVLVESDNPGEGPVLIEFASLPKHAQEQVETAERRLAAKEQAKKDQRDAMRRLHEFEGYGRHVASVMEKRDQAVEIGGVLIAACDESGRLLPSQAGHNAPTTPVEQTYRPNSFGHVHTVVDLLGQLAAAASTCWERPWDAGIFDSAAANIFIREAEIRLGEILSAAPVVTKPMQPTEASDDFRGHDDVPPVDGSTENWFASCESIDQLLGELAGGVSISWEHPDRAGIFDSTRAKNLVDHAIERLAQMITGIKGAPEPAEFKFKPPTLVEIDEYAKKRADGLSSDPEFARTMYWFTLDGTYDRGEPSEMSARAWEVVTSQLKQRWRESLRPKTDWGAFPIPRKGEGQPTVADVAEYETELTEVDDSEFARRVFQYAFTGQRVPENEIVFDSVRRAWGMMVTGLVIRDRFRR